MEPISLKKSQEILLDLAIVVRDIAASHNIDFFMVGGTMLGAVRHKGFIPWDDDMDFGVKYDHYFELIQILKKELPPRYRCLYYEDNSPVHSFFFKVEDTRTVLDDPCFNIPIERKLGLSIDVFPIVSCTKESGLEVSLKVKQLREKERMRIIPQNASWRKIIAKKITALIHKGDNTTEKRSIKVLLDSIVPGSSYCNIVSPQFWNIIWTKETFDQLARYTFENTFFLGPKDFDSYLSKCYKNYMDLPPENKRRAHATFAFFRD